jgi:branched-chain amino acid transport system substrate-binding protein
VITRRMLAAGAASSLAMPALVQSPAWAQSPALAQSKEPVKIGVLTALTGPFSESGVSTVNGMKAWLVENGDTMAGRKIELVVKDDGGVPDASRRLALELLTGDKVQVLMGFVLTPIALAVAPAAGQAKVPAVVTLAATSSITQASPYVVRTGQTIPQGSMPFGIWAKQHGINRVVTVVSDYGPGYDAEKWFSIGFTKQGGQVLSSLRVPLANPDFAPYLQRARDAAPDGIFVFIPSGPATVFMRQYAERGLDKAGIKLIGTGEIVDDSMLPEMGDVALGVVTESPYSAYHQSEQNMKFRKAYATLTKIRPNIPSVGAYDGMELVSLALQKTGGDSDGTKLIEAMKGMAWESPRGPVRIDPDTRDIIQNIYVRRVERKDGELYAVEFDTIPMVKDPAKG